MGSGILEPFPLLPDQRPDLRKQLRLKRRDIPSHIQRKSAKDLLLHCRRWPDFHQARTVAFYLPIQGEISPLPLMHLAHALGKACYLPRIRPFPAGSLVFVRWRPGSRLYRQRWHIREPRHGGRREARGLDLVFMPLTGFDRQGHRLGMGGGFYDRTLAKLPQRPLRVGLAHDSQQVASIPVCPWDINLHAVVTPSGRTSFRAGASRRIPL